MSEDAGWDSFGPDFHAAVQAAAPRGWMSYKELDAVLPRADLTAKQIEDLLAYLRRRGIELYEDDGPQERL